MDESEKVRQNWPREPLSLVAPLIACAGVLGFALPAQAQAAAPEAPAAEARAQAEAPAEPADAQASVDASAEVGMPAAAAKGPAAKQELEDVVTGYRKSLDAALTRKQRSTEQVDAIVADDIADFPDLNLAESLQRIPGVAITRDNGEGNRITVRGLSGEYTRTRLNGMDTRVAIGNNTTRSFDFRMTWSVRPGALNSRRSPTTRARSVPGRPRVGLRLRSKAGSMSLTTTTSRSSRTAAPPARWTRTISGRISRSMGNSPSALATYGSCITLV